MRHVSDQQYRRPGPGSLTRYLGRVRAVFTGWWRLCLLIVLLCGVTIVAGDDTRSSAVSIALNSSANGTISPEGDVDYWRIDVPSQGLLEVETGGDTDTVGVLEGSTGNRIDYGDDGGVDENFMIVVAVAAGTYYIRVSGYSFEDTGPYTLHVRHAPDTVDDTRASAISIAPDSSSNGAISPEGDVDYWRIEVPSQGQLGVETSGSTDTLGELQDSFGNRIDYDDDEGADENFNIVVAAAAGTYYIRVSGYSFEDTGHYTLHVRYAPDADSSATPENRAIPPLTFGDFNGDGRDDVLLRHTDGSWFYYPMDGRRHVTGGSGSADLTSDRAWQFAGIGDLNGDGRDDVLLRHTDGSWFYYPMNGRRLITGGSGLADMTRNLAWQFAGIGDLNGDGKDDVLVRHDDGRWFYYPMDGRYHIVSLRGLADMTRNLAWQFAGIGDLNGDGKDDVLLRHEDGRWWYYPMDGRRHIVSGRGFADLTRNLVWQFAGIGDLNGDGRDDVLLRHEDGRWWYYPMDGRRHITSGRGFANLTRNLAWQFAGIGDLNGDGRDDVLVRNEDGRWFYYPMDGRYHVVSGRGLTNLTSNINWSINSKNIPEMVSIPGGTFHMGDFFGEDIPYERPIHSVTVPPFKLGKYEVTFAQWEACVADGGCGDYRPDDKSWGRGSRPVIGVSWDDAQLYIDWLNSKTGGGYRLPAEAEWEYAARAGRTRKYSWGDDIDTNRANCNGCGSQWDYDRTAPVGSFPANAWGLHDMHGNVWEWVQDCVNGNYEGAPSDGSAWESGNCEVRIVRGGAWPTIPQGLRSAARNAAARSGRLTDLGFRMVQDP